MEPRASTLMEPIDEEAGKPRVAASEEPVRRRTPGVERSGSSKDKDKPKRRGTRLKTLPMLAACTMVFGPLAPS